MSRIEGKIESNGEEPVDAADILAALLSERKAGARRRQDAVALYLSAGDGWREASAMLDGAFASRGEEDEG